MRSTSVKIELFVWTFRSLFDFLNKQAAPRSKGTAHVVRCSRMEPLFQHFPHPIRGLDY
ncbi:MAG: hypothetical protein K0R28_7209, partial [Paenibacillus sp.]|nr:hypothetical protein [Paenibacillus sp.]